MKEDATRHLGVASALLGALALVLAALPAASSQTLGSASTPTAPASSALACSLLELFHREGCPHCERAIDFLERLTEDHPALEVRAYDVALDATARERFARLNREFGIGRPGVPSMLMCGEFLVGFDPTLTPALVRERLLGPAPGAPVVAEAQGDGIELPLLGRVAPADVGLPLFTIAIGLLDGFNPCAMWVLLFLLSLLVNLRDRRRMLLIAGTFVLMSGIVYFAFMAAWLNVFLVLGVSRSLQVAVAVLALAIGTIHVKDFLAPGTGTSLAIPASARPGIYARVRAIVQAENLPWALALAIVLAAMVNTVELLCTAGLPALYTRILTLRELEMAAYYGYLLLYNAAYVLDDALMVGVAVYSLSKAKLSAKQGRWLKLLSGATVIALGLILLVSPNALF